jgi:hypothetical protein
MAPPRPLQRLAKLPAVALLELEGDVGRQDADNVVGECFDLCFGEPWVIDMQLLVDEGPMRDSSYFLCRFKLMRTTCVS